MTDPNWCHQPVITQLMITHWPLPMQWFMDYFNTVFALFICEIGCNARFYLTLPITYLIVFSMQKRRRRPDLLTSSILRLIEHLILGGMLIFWLRRPKPICFGLIKFLRILSFNKKAPNPSKFEEFLLILLKSHHALWTPDEVFFHWNFKLWGLGR